MVEAYVLVETRAGTALEVADAAGGFDGVCCAEAAAGPYDVVVRTKTESIEALNRLVALIQELEGVARTMTCFVLERGAHFVEAESCWAGGTAA